MPLLQKTIIDISSNTIFRVVLILLAIVFLYYIRDVLLILLVSIILAAAMDPFADFFQRHRVPRALAVLIVYGVFLAILALIIALIVPPVAKQVSQLSENIPYAIDVITEKYNASQVLIERYNIEDRFQQLFEILGKGLGDFSLNGGGILSRTLSLFGGFASFLLILVISFYFTVDEGGIKRFLKLLSPKEHEPYVINLFERIQLKLAKWVQGQLFLAVLMGVVIGVVLWAVGIPYALVFGLIAGLLELIPVIGPIVAAIPAIIVAFFVSPLHGAGILAFYIIINQVENHILVPKIMQKAVGLHPVLVIIAMLIGWRLAGFVGVLLAVPVATIVVVFVRDFLGNSKEKQEKKEVLRTSSD